MSKQETRIPFSGFYESIHNQGIENAINNYFDKDGNGEGQQPDSFYFSFNSYGDIRRDYANLYTLLFSQYFEDKTGIPLPLTYKTLVSPKEYNFQTDRIFCDIPEKTVKSIFENCDKGILSKTIEEQFTSRDGFSSYYSNSLESWLGTPLEKWDHNQLCTLIESFIADNVDEYELLESALCNGKIDILVYSYLSQWESDNPIKAQQDTIKRVLDIPDHEWESYSEDQKQRAIDRLNDITYHCSKTLELPLCF